MNRSISPLFCLFLLLINLSRAVAQKTIGSATLNAPQMRVALLIGNNKYSNVRPLNNPEHDVDALKKVLESLGFKVLAYKNLSLSEAQRVYQEFLTLLDKQKPEVAWVYFSGHGVGVNGVNYLLPTDTNIGCVEQLQSYEAASLNRWIEELSHRKIKHNFIFVDACRDLASLKHCDGAAINGSVRGLAKPYEKYRGFLIGFATTEGETADDDTHDKTNSLFTAELLKYLPTPNIGIRQILDLTKQGVFLRSEHSQDPKRWDDLVEDYVFTKTIVEPPPPAKVIEVIAYKPNSTDIDMNVAKLTVLELKEKFPDYIISPQANSKSISKNDNVIRCTVTRETDVKMNSGEAYGNRLEGLTLTNTVLKLTFKKGNDLIDEVETKGTGNDYDKERSLKHSIEESAKDIKNQIINIPAQNVSKR